MKINVNCLEPKTRRTCYSVLGYRFLRGAGPVIQSPALSKLNCELPGIRYFIGQCLANRYKVHNIERNAKRKWMFRNYLHLSQQSHFYPDARQNPLKYVQISKSIRGKFRTTSFNNLYLANTVVSLSLKYWSGCLFTLKLLRIRGKSLLKGKCIRNPNHFWFTRYGQDLLF